MKIQICTALNFFSRKCQDALVAKLYDDGSKGLFIVCDGMDGRNKGNKVSQTVVDVFAKVWDEGHSHTDINSLLARSVIETKSEIGKLKCDKTAMTMVLVATEGEEVTIAYWGDSRTYFHRKKDNLLIHSLHHISTEKDELPRVPQDVLNFSDTDKAYIIRLTAKDGDRILLCTDGLYNCYKGNSLLELLAQDMPIDTIMSNIIGYCDGRSTDDVSGIIIEFKI